MARLGRGESQHAFPVLKAKAGNTILIIKWLSHVAGQHRRNEEQRMRTSMLWSLAEVLQICEIKRQYLSTAEREQFLRVGHAALLCYSGLASLAASRGVALYCLKPKHHALKHIIDNAHRCGRNPGWDWEFADESFVGIAKRIATRTHASVVSLRTAQRWLIGLYLRLSDG